MNFSKIAGAVAATLMVVLAAPALAVTPISTPVQLDASELGSKISIKYNGYSTETLRPYLTASSFFKLTAVSADKKSWSFSILSIANTSTAPVTSDRLAGFGFDTFGSAPTTNATVAFSSATITGATPFTNIIYGGSFPQVATNLSVCFNGGGGNCAAGGPAGLAKGTSITSGSFVLKFASAVQKINFNHFSVRYNAIVGTGTDPSGTGLVGQTPFVEILPEPGIWMQLIIGFGLVGAAVRRRRTDAAIA